MTKEIPARQKIFCPIRREWVTSLPEELVRQRVLTYMIEKLGFPSSLITVETPLKQLPHLSTNDLLSIPDRRVDIICFTNGPSGVHPLLLIECKAIKLTPRVVSQVIGYNEFVKSHLIAIFNETEMRVGYYDKEKKEYLFIDYLPSYQELVRKLC